MMLNLQSGFDWIPSISLLATEAVGEDAPKVLARVLLSLITIYLASKLGGELSKIVNLPPILGELVGGVVVGVSALHLLVFAGIGAASGVLDKPLQAAIIIMVILTTFIAPPLLRLAFQEDSDPASNTDLAVDS